MMEFLGLIYGISSVLVPLIGLSTLRAAVEYRAIGIRREDTVRGAATMLGISLLWSAVAVALLLLSPWSHGAAFSVEAEHAVLGIAPVVVGWIPGLGLLAIGAGTTPGTLDVVPAWAKWMDALWMA